MIMTVPGRSRSWVTVTRWAVRFPSVSLRNRSCSASTSSGRDVWNSTICTNLAIAGPLYGSLAAPTAAPPRPHALLELGGLLLQGREGIVERLREEVNTLALERRRDVVEIDARFGEVRHHPARALDVPEDRVGAKIPVAVGERVERRLGERVHGVPADEVVDVQRR